MDFNKEIKLSDLVRRPKKKTPGVSKPSSAKRKRRRKQEIVGLKIGASQIAASRVVNNGGPAAKLALDCITNVEVLDYPELGMEAVWKIEVVNFPAFVVVDDKGNDFFSEVSKPVRIRKI